jgi:MYXO-CTERM domain-containing protein
VSLTDPSSASVDDGGDATQGGGEVGPTPEPGTTMPPVLEGTGGDDGSEGTSSSGGLGQDGDMLGRGCGCDAARPHGGLALLGLALLGQRRRRQPASAAST